MCCVHLVQFLMVITAPTVLKKQKSTWTVNDKRTEKQQMRRTCIAVPHQESKQKERNHSALHLLVVFVLFGLSEFDSSVVYPRSFRDTGRILISVTAMHEL